MHHIWFLRSPSQFTKLILIQLWRYWTINLNRVYVENGIGNISSVKSFLILNFFKAIKNDISKICIWKISFNSCRNFLKIVVNFFLYIIWMLETIQKHNCPCFFSSSTSNPLRLLCFQLYLYVPTYFRL